jgi:predicted MFS family arabinose efflux permease
MVGAAGVAGALLGGTSSQLFGFRETALGAAILSILGFLVYKTLGDNFEGTDS